MLVFQDWCLNKIVRHEVLISHVSGDIPADYYVVVLKPGDHQFTADQYEVVISELAPYSIYSFAVSAHNNVGTRGKSSALQTRTGKLSFCL